MYRTLFSLIIYTFLFCSIVSAQSSGTRSSPDSCTVQDLAWVNTGLRYCLVERGAMKRFVRLIEGLKRHANGRRELRPFLFDLHYLSVIKNRPLDSVRAALEDRERYGAQLIQQIKEKDLATLRENRLMMELVSNHIVDFTNDHDMLYVEELCQEINFYELGAAKHIGEIGAGDGFYSRFLSLLYPSATFHVNEVDTTLVNYIASFEASCLPPDFITSCEVVLGTETSTGINQPLDRAIIRNSFHHFSEKEAMLSDIKTILQPDGLLCLKESVRNDANERGCKKRMTEEEILSILQANGWQLEERIARRGTLFLKFSVAD